MAFIGVTQLVRHVGEELRLDTGRLPELGIRGCQGGPLSFQLPVRLLQLDGPAQHQGGHLLPEVTLGVARSAARVLKCPGQP